MFHGFASFPPDFVEYSNSVNGRSNRCKKVVASVELTYGTPAGNKNKREQTWPYGFSFSHLYDGIQELRHWQFS
jgi:hypothetical protein